MFDVRLLERRNANIEHPKSNSQRRTEEPLTLLARGQPPIPFASPPSTGARGPGTRRPPGITALSPSSSTRIVPQPKIPQNAAMDASRAFRCDDEVALVTGGGTGLGLAAARCLAAAGARVVIAGRREDVLADAAREVGA